jgi:beta-lactamase class A
MSLASLIAERAGGPRVGTTAAVACRPLGDPGVAVDPPCLFNAGVRFHAASTMKVAVMIELYRQAAAGRLALEDAITVTNRFRSIVDGGPYELPIQEETDRAMRSALGRPVPLRTLCEAMIVVSSNLATNTLLCRLGVKNVQATVDDLGASGLHVRRGVEDGLAFARGINSTTDAQALLTIFWKLGRGEVVSAAASAEMAALLRRQTHNDGIPAGLPPGTPVAHKTGTISGIHHDAGIVYGPRPYALVVLTKGIEDPVRSARLIADVTRTVHESVGIASADGVSPGLQLM